MAIIDRTKQLARAKGNAAYYAQHLESLMRWAAREGRGGVNMSIDTAECIAATLRSFMAILDERDDNR